MAYYFDRFQTQTVGCLTLMLLLAVAGWAQAAAVPCEPSPEVKQALRKLPDESRERAAELKALLERFPADLFLNRAYQDSVKYRGAREFEDLKAHYRALAEKNPGDRVYAYLATRSLIGTQTKEAIAQLEKHLERSPDFPYPHLSLVEIHQAPVFRDTEKARRHLELFMKACPASLEAFRYMRPMEPSDFVKQGAEKLRALIQNATVPEAVRVYSILWTLEFRVRPAGEHAALRKQVAEDVQRLRAADPGDSRDFANTLREGYQLTGDAKNEEWAQDLLKNKFASKSSAYYQAYEEWRKKNPYPKPDDPPEKRRAHDEALLKATEEWVRQWPDPFFLRLQRFSAVRTAEDVPAAVVEEAGEGLLKVKDRSDGFYTSVPLTLQVAQLYVNKGVRLERAAELLAQSFRELEQGPGRVPVRWDLYPREEAPGADISQLSMMWDGWVAAANVAIKLKDKDKARETVQRLDTMIEKLKPAVKGDGKDPIENNKQRMYSFRQLSYWDRKGGLAEMEGRKMDAFIFYQNAMLSRPASTGHVAKPPKDELAEKTRALWKEFGGSDEGWQAWVNRRETLATAAPAGPPGPLDRWTKMDKKLPEFALVDIRGKKWTLAELKGKLSFVTLWATW